jgi:hypothetical protein
MIFTSNPLFKLVYTFSEDASLEQSYVWIDRLRNI